MTAHRSRIIRLQLPGLLFPGSCRKLDNLPFRGIDNLVDHARELLERDPHLVLVFMSIVDATDAAYRVSKAALCSVAIDPCPAGIRRVLKHLPTQVLRQQNYRLLIQLLDDRDSANVLHHASKIDDLAIAVLAELPQPLRRALPLAFQDWPRKLNDLVQSLQFLVSRRADASFDDLVAQLATVTAWPRVTAMIGLWNETLPLPESIPPARIANARRLDNGETWRNCLARRHGRLGWFLDEVKGPRNIEIEPGQLEVITAAFAHVGVPSSQVVRAIENIIYGDSDALRPMDEDW